MKTPFAVKKQGEKKKGKTKKKHTSRPWFVITHLAVKKVIGRSAAQTKPVSKETYYRGERDLLCADF